MLGVQDVLLGVGSETSDKQLKLLNFESAGKFGRELQRLGAF